MTENKRSISDCEELAALGWQAITCPSCKNVGARGYPRNTTPPAAQQRIDRLEAELMQMQGREIKLQMSLNTPAAQPAPPECQTEAEKTAFAFGWWKALESVRQPAVPDAFGTREGEHPQYVQGWNDCRAEMLGGVKP
jgi:hypothetical protein